MSYLALRDRRRRPFPRCVLSGAPVAQPGGDTDDAGDVVDAGGVDVGDAMSIDAGEDADEKADAADAQADAADAQATDGPETDGDAGNACALDGNPNAAFCDDAGDVVCCTPTPSVADNPPVPAGYKLMPQSDVTPDMTSWAVAILDDPTDYPLFATAMRTFGTVTVLARVEWHAPDFQNDMVHRGITLYEPA